METLTFYRKMANSNLEIMKKYKYNQINKLDYNGIVELYRTNNLDFDKDVIRLQTFMKEHIKVIQPLVEKTFYAEIQELTDKITPNHIYMSLLVIPVISFFLFYKKK